MKLQASRPKETQTQVFSFKYCKIFKNTCFENYLPTVVFANHDVHNSSEEW